MEQNGYDMADIFKIGFDVVLFFSFFLSLQEPSNKRVKPLSRVTSLANLIPPVKTTPLKRFSQTLQVREGGLGLQKAVLCSCPEFLLVSRQPESPPATAEEFR